MYETPMSSAGEYALEAQRAIRRANETGLDRDVRDARLAEAQVWATLALAASNQPASA